MFVNMDICVGLEIFIFELINLIFIYFLSSKIKNLKNLRKDQKKIIERSSKQMSNIIERTSEGIAILNENNL